MIGPGAVGCYFGGLLARGGHDVTLFGRPGSSSAHLEAVCASGIRFEGVTVRETVPVRVSGDLGELHDHDVVLFCVKSMHTTAAADAASAHLRDDTIAVSLQNGVENTDRLRAAGIDARPAVVYVAAAIEAPGTVVHRGRGDLALGDSPSDRAFASMCVPAGIPCELVPDIDARLWTKLVINSMGNAISAIAGVPYRAIRAYEPAWRVALAVADEAFAVAAASGIEVDRERVLAQAEQVLESVGNATSSTEQDLSRGRPTEIEALNGFFSRKGRALGVPTPTNDALTALVGLREHTRTDR